MCSASVRSFTNIRYEASRSARSFLFTPQQQYFSSCVFSAGVWSFPFFFLWGAPGGQIAIYLRRIRNAIWALCRQPAHDHVQIFVVGVHSGQIAFIYFTAIIFSERCVFCLRPMISTHLLRGIPIGQTTPHVHHSKNTPRVLYPKAVSDYLQTLHMRHPKLPDSPYLHHIKNTPRDLCPQS